MRIDYYAYQSGMKNWNAGLKVLLAVGTLCLVIGLDQLFVSLFVAVTMGALTLLAGKIPWKAYFHFITIPLVFLVFSSAAIALDVAAHPAGTWNLPLHFFYLCMTSKSLWMAANVFFKAAAGMSALCMMALSTPVHEIILVFRRMHFPELLVELMNLVYRYIFILFEAAYQMQTAAKARLGYQSFSRSLRSFAGIAGNLFLISLKKANTYYDALLARGYDGKLEFLTEELPIKTWQVIGSVIYFMVLLFIALAKKSLWPG